MTSPVNAGASDLDRGKELASICASCHTLDRHEANQQSITGLDVEQFIHQMQAFRKSEHPNMIMYRVSRSLSDQELSSLGIYLSKLGTEAKLP